MAKKTETKSDFDDKKTPAPKVVKTKEDIEREFDDKRKAQVDSDNAVAEVVANANEAKLADTSLNQEEVDFIARIEPRMNNGKHQPTPVDIQRYSRLIKRKDV